MEYDLLEEKEEISALLRGLKTEKEFLEELDERTSTLNWKSVCWTCYHCNQTYNDVPSFSTHQQLMHQITNAHDIVYQCNECREPVLEYASFLNHVRNVHYESLKLCCDVCNEDFPNHRELAAHRDKHVRRVNNFHPIVYHCTLCAEVRSTESEVKNHIQNSHSSKTTCTTNQVFTSKQQKKERKHQRATQQQLQYYINFSKDHPDLWTRKNLSKKPRAIQQLWLDLAEKLNSMRGPTRTPEKWKETFNQLKNQMHCRARKSGEHQRLSDQRSTSPEMEQQQHETLRISAVQGKGDVAILGFQDVSDLPPEENCAKAYINFQEATIEEKAIVNENKESIVTEPFSVRNYASATEDLTLNDSNSRKRLTPQAIYEKLNKSITMRNEIQERSLKLQEQMLQQQLETNAALIRIEESISALVGALVKR